MPSFAVLQDFHALTSHRHREGGRALAGLPLSETKRIEILGVRSRQTQEEWAGEASGFAVAVTVGIGATRWDRRVLMPRDSSLS